MQNRNVQIPYELFLQLLQYFLMDNYDGEEKIRLGLEKKLDAMVNREMYSKFKTTPTEDESEESLTVKDALVAWSPFILVLVFLLITSTLVPAIHDPLSAIKSSVPIYTGEDRGYL